MLLSLLITGDYTQAIIVFLSLLFIVMCINPVHEFAHAFAAYKLGDNTAKNAGRLTLNPLASLDIMGALLFFVAGIGWAKPVPINSRNFKHQKLGTVITAAAGPFSNLLLAFIFLLICAALDKFMAASQTHTLIVYALGYIAQINVLLAMFNLIPLPPLDGSRVLSGLLPDRIYFKMFRFDRYLRNGIMILLLLNMLLARVGIDLLYPLRWVEAQVYNGLGNLAYLIFGLKF